MRFFLAYPIENVTLITNMCLLRFLKTFFRSKKSKNFEGLQNVKKSSFQTNAPSFFPFEFRISKLSFSDSELKAESEKLSLKVPERELDLSKCAKQAWLKNSNRFRKPNTTFSWAPKSNILTWFDSPETPLQKYTSTFLKFFFFAEKIDFHLTELLNRQIPCTFYANLCSVSVENKQKRFKTNADHPELFGE